MIQQQIKLSSDIHHTLKDCEEIWIAVALISDSGFRYIQDNINEAAKQNYLVGIGLPTSPKVLEELKSKNDNGIFRSKVYHNSNELFHPKVYLIKSNNKLTAYVGSGNCTNGGFTKNLEFNIKTDDVEFCNELKDWFYKLFEDGKIITDEFLKNYIEVFEGRLENILKDKEQIKNLFPPDELDLSSDVELNIDYSTKNNSIDELLKNNKNIYRNENEEKDFFEQLLVLKGQKDYETAVRILEWIRPKVDEIKFGSGKNFSLIPILNTNVGVVRSFTLWTYGQVEIVFQYMKNKSHNPLFNNRGKRLELLKKLNKINGIDFSEDDTEKRPNIFISQLSDEKEIQNFFAVFEWYFNEHK